MQFIVLKDFPGYRAGSTVDLSLRSGRYQAADGFWMDKDALEASPYFRPDVDPIAAAQKFFYVDRRGQVQEILSTDPTISNNRASGNLYPDARRALMAAERVLAAYKE